MPDNSLAKIEINECPLYSGYHNSNVKINWYDYGVHCFTLKKIIPEDNTGSSEIPDQR
jgi:hypothetical protein